MPWIIFLLLAECVLGLTITENKKKIVLAGSTIKVGCNATGNYSSYVNYWWWGVEDLVEESKEGVNGRRIWRNIYSYRALMDKKKGRYGRSNKVLRKRSLENHAMKVKELRKRNEYMSQLLITDAEKFDTGKYICLPIVPYSEWLRMRTRIIYTFNVVVKPLPLKFPWQLYKNNGVPKDIISLSAGQFLLWATTENQNIYISFNGFFWIPIKGQLRRISANSAGIWGINNDGQIFYRSNWDYTQPTGRSWESTLAGKYSWKDVASGPPGVVLALDEAGNLFCRSILGTINVGGSKWVKVNTTIKFEQITCNSHGCWGFSGETRSIYYTPIPKRAEICIDPEKTGFRNWTFVTSGDFKQLVPGVGPTLLVVSTNGHLLERHTTHWNDIFKTQLPWKDTQLLDISTASSNTRRHYAITSAGDIYSSLISNCGGTLVNRAGKLPLPEFDTTLLDPKKEITCLWTISVASVEKVLMTFKDYNANEFCKICISVVRGKGFYADSVETKKCISGKSFKYTGYGGDFIVEAVLPSLCITGLRPEYTSV